MISFLGMERHKAHAMSLVIIFSMAVIASASYLFYGNINVWLSFLLLLGSSTSVILGAKVMHKLSARKLGILFAVLLVLLGFRMLFNVEFVGDSFTPKGYYPVLVVLIGGFTGFMSGMLGVGGALVSVPGLMFFAGVTQQMAQGVTLLAYVPTSVIGSYTHWKNGFLDLSAAFWIILGTLFSSAAGAYFANHLSAHALRITLSAVMLLVASKTFLSVFLENPTYKRRKTNRLRDK